MSFLSYSWDMLLNSLPSPKPLGKSLPSPQNLFSLRLGVLKDFLNLPIFLEFLWQEEFIELPSCCGMKFV